MHNILDWVLQLPHELAVLIVAALPIFELRGSIPLGFYLGMPLAKIVMYSIIGNMLPIVPWMFFLEPITNFLSKLPVLRRFFDWMFERTRKKADVVQKYEAIGLAIFVAIPLPMTGAWSGAIAASLFKIKFRYAFWGILAGVIGAAAIVVALCMVGKLTWHVYQQ